MIDWKTAQTRLTERGYACGAIDGVPGALTYTSVFAWTAGRQPDDTIRAIGKAAAVYLPAFGIERTSPRLGEFAAQTCNETGGYTRFWENMRYSAARLMVIWPKRFPTLASALHYAWDASDPDAEDKALADLVYGARMGNQRNGTNDDDGWLRRGRGMLGLTGYDNDAHFGPLVGVDLIAHPELAADPEISLHIACEFWSEAGVNSWVDRGDFYAARGVTNGGAPHPIAPPIGLQHVADLRARVLEVLQ
jgi:putative chitinase